MNKTKITSWTFRGISINKHNHALKIIKHHLVKTNSWNGKAGNQVSKAGKKVLLARRNVELWVQVQSEVLHVWIPFWLLKFSKLCFMLTNTGKFRWSWWTLVLPPREPPGIRCFICVSKEADVIATCKRKWAECRELTGLIVHLLCAKHDAGDPKVMRMQQDFWLLPLHFGVS